ncbi:glycosyltransferase family 47 protein [Favolaschia claudopus]|uniref:Glycosyltransferase family 47 protein n=1 Tax=Favolaschia claudopus TaxID=2862362 RepID=A0AAW0BXM0_9AGAR
MNRRARLVLLIIAFCVVLSVLLSWGTLALQPTNLNQKQPRNFKRSNPQYNLDSPQSPLQDSKSNNINVVAPSRRVLVTGGGGNIGKHLVRRLLLSQVAVTVIDLVFDPNEHDFPEVGLLTFIAADIRNTTAMDLALTPDVVGIVHLAAVSRVVWCSVNEVDCMNVNEGGTGAILEAIQKKEANFRPWFILASSREIYGRDGKNSKAAIPSTVYGLSKLKAEQVLQRYARRVNSLNKRSFHAVILRLSSVYGSINDHKDRLVTALVSRGLIHQTVQIIGGEQQLDFLYIDDCVDAFMLAIFRLEHKSPLLEPSMDVFDVRGFGSIGVQQLVDKILVLTRSKSPVESLPQDPRFSSHYATSSVVSLPGYTPKISLDAGLFRLVNLYLKRSASYLKKRLDDECVSQDQPHILLGKDIRKLDGCVANLLIDIDGQTWSLSFDRNPKHLEAPDDMGPGTPEDYGPIWVISERIIPDPVKLSIQSRNGKLFLRISAIRTYAGHVLGVYSSSHPEFTRGFMFDHIELEHVGHDVALVDWEMIVNERDGTFKLVFPDSGFQVSSPTRFDGWFTWVPVEEDIYPFRLSPTCCPAPPPWPFYEQDPIQHSIHMDRFSKDRPFNKTIPQTLCLRVEAALAHAQASLTWLDQVRRDGHNEYLRRMGNASEWVDNALIACSNDCKHPTICLNTGDCSCVGTIYCPVPERFPFASFQHTATITYPLPDIGSLSLLESAKQTSWFSILRPEAARYLGTNPTWPQVHIAAVDIASESLRGPRLESVSRLLERDCFSADASLEMALRTYQTSYSKADVIFQPYYHARMWTNQEDLPKLMAQLETNYPNHSSQVVLPFTYDWGICLFFTWTIWEARQKFKVPPSIRDVIAWSVMADTNSPCYRPHQDVVIPPRGCRTRQLRGAFAKPDRIQPSAARTQLVYFSGTSWGSGGSLRKKLACARTIPNEGQTGFEQSRAEMGLGPVNLTTRWTNPLSHADYVAILNNTIFCAVPAGVAGWAPRIEDAIYAGCIPVMFDDDSHLPFWELLDWRKFSVRIFTHQVQYLERILMSYSLREIQRMQTNLLHVRDILMYPLDNHHSEMVTIRSPLSFALYQTKLRLATRWPTEDFEVEGEVISFPPAML